MLFKGPGWTPGKPRLDDPADIPEVLKDPSHPQCFARIKCEFCHFLCHLKSGFFHSELKSGYIRTNTASLGLHLLFWP